MFAGTYLLDGLYVYFWGVQDGVVCSGAHISHCMLQSLLVGFELGVRRAVIDGISIFHCHKGAGKRSVRRTASLMLPWALFVWFAEFVWQQRPTGRADGNHDTADWADASFWKAHNTAAGYETLALTLEGIYVGALLLFYGALAITPGHIVFRRPALGRAYLCWQLVTMGLIAADVIEVGLNASSKYCLRWVALTAIEVTVGPLVLCGTLRDDSKYWQGLLFVKPEQPSAWGRFLGAAFLRSSDSSSPSIASGATSRATSVPGTVDLTQPLLGQYLSVDAAQELASSMEQLAHARECEYIHFGLLQIETVLGADHPSAAVLGAGGAAKVYRGRYRGESVAIKMIWSVDITADIVAAFREEVMICAKLSRHKNIVHVKGFSIMPPALCVVMELCNAGSLFDLLRQFREEELVAEEAERNAGQLLRQGKFPDPGSDMEAEVRARAPSWPLRLQMACECAEAIAFLHLQTPPVMHKDVKVFTPHPPDASMGTSLSPCP